METEISVIIITFNSSREINGLLKAIYPGKTSNIEIVVIDNASSDDSVDIVKRKYPAVRIVENNKNEGFAKAANKAAKNAHGKLLLFLNPDAEIKNSSLKKALSLFNKDNEIAVLGGKTVYPDGSLQPSIGMYPTIMNVIFDRLPVLNMLFKTQIIRNPAVYKRNQNPDWVSGSCLFIRKKVFEQVKGFDEGYFMYVEDVDLCYRINKTGFKILYSPLFKVTHQDQGKSKAKKSAKSSYMRKGISRFFRKYKSANYVKLWETILKIESLLKV